MEPEYFYRVLKYHWHIFMRTLDPQIIFFLFFLSNIFFYSIQSFLKQDFLAGCICIIGGNKISEPCRERNLWGLGLLVSTSVGQASLERGTGQGNFRGHGGGQLVKTNRIVVWYVGIQFLAALCSLVAFVDESKSCFLSDVNVLNLGLLGKVFYKIVQENNWHPYERFSYLAPKVQLMKVRKRAPSFFRWDCRDHGQNVKSISFCRKYLLMASLGISRHILHLESLCFFGLL